VAQFTTPGTVRRGARRRSSAESVAIAEQRATWGVKNGWVRFQTSELDDFDSTAPFDAVIG
jgi:hypothetical protein